MVYLFMEVFFRNGFDENFQHYFVIVNGYYITKVCITNIITFLKVSEQINKRDIFYDEMLLSFS